jgi:hypothetical protein
MSHPRSLRIVRPKKKMCRPLVPIETAVRVPPHQDLALVVSATPTHYRLLGMDGRTVMAKRALIDAAVEAGLAIPATPVWGLLRWLPQALARAKKK